MSLESWVESKVEGILDNSLFARAARKSAAKSWVLGWLDAVQNPNAVLAEIVGSEAQGMPPTEKALSPVDKALPPPEKRLLAADKSVPPAPSAPASPSQPVTLPKPMLLAMPGRDTEDEPDQPGVPPKRVRERKKATDNGQAKATATDTASGETPK